MSRAGEPDTTAVSHAATRPTIHRRCAPRSRRIATATRNSSRPRQRRGARKWVAGPIATVIWNRRMCACVARPHCILRGPRAGRQGPAIPRSLASHAPLPAPSRHLSTRFQLAIGWLTRRPRSPAAAARVEVRGGGAQGGRAGGREIRRGV